MGWSIGFDEHWNRDIGYGVPCECDHPECKEQIDRGLSYVCGSDPYGGEHGCGLYFCGEHLFFKDVENKRTIKTEDRVSVFLCDNCYDGKEPFSPKPDVPKWINHKLTDESWHVWRDENPEQVKELKKSGSVLLVIDEAAPVDKSIWDKLEKFSAGEKITRFKTEFVEFMPEEIKPGVLYVS